MCGEGRGAGVRPGWYFKPISPRIPRFVPAVRKRLTQLIAANRDVSVDHFLTERTQRLDRCCAAQ